MIQYLNSYVAYNTNYMTYSALHAGIYKTKLNKQQKSVLEAAFAVHCFPNITNWAKYDKGQTMVCEDKVQNKTRKMCRNTIHM